ncbi:MAG: hypothetical protein GY711_32445 [bacterium]|nr:hypothetical protein [bacterium]
MLIPLLLAPLAIQDARVDQASINAAIDRGAVYLQTVVDEKRGKGRKKKKKKSRIATERLGLRALVLYTLLKCDVDRDASAVRELVDGIAFESADQTYDVACMLLALAAHDPIGHRLWIEELAALLVGWQEDNGAWGYPGMIIDLSNTQYAALGLWAASRAGVEVAPQVWERLAHATLSYGGEDGGFNYTPSGEGATGSMTTAGIGTLALCEIHLRKAGAVPTDLEPKLGAARRAGLAWLDANFSVETNPRSGAWLYYYLYGLERMGGLAGSHRVGEHYWYAEGASFLVPRQDEDGSWQGGTDLSQTCFALLFLKRATSGESQPRTPVVGAARKADEQGAIRLAFEGAGPVDVWIEGWRPLDVSKLEWPGERGLGPRVARVEYLADGELVGVVLGDAAQAAFGARFRFEWVPGRSGARTLSARAHVQPPSGGASGGAPLILESGELAVDVSRAAPAWLASRGPGVGPNLATGFRPSARASSKPKKSEKSEGLADREFEAELAVDGLIGTPWLAAAKDEKRALKISYRKASPVDVVRIHPARIPSRGPGFLTRPLALEVQINGGKVHELRLEDPGRPATIELAARTKIKRIDVRIVEVAAGEHPAVGIGEVTLHARETDR